MRGDSAPFPQTSSTTVQILNDGGLCEEACSIVASINFAAVVAPLQPSKTVPNVKASSGESQRVAVSTSGRPPHALGSWAKPNKSDAAY